MTERARLNATGLPARAISATDARRLSEGWSLLRADPGAHDEPSGLPTGADWREAVVPGTVAAAVGPDDLDRHVDYDRYDWWYRCELPRDSVQAGQRVRLRLDGLATLAEVWLNGTLVLESSNMFLVHEVDVTDLVEDVNELTIACRSLGHALGERRPRARWKTQLVDDQQLRWFRTTLLGRIPGWTPAIRPLGPWRPVWLEVVELVDVESLTVRAELDGDDGVVRVDGALRTLGASGTEPTVERAVVRLGEAESELAVDASEEGRWAVRGELRIEDPELWWPRTHGDPTLHPCSIQVETSEGHATIDCGEVGFRSIDVDRTGGRIGFVVNGVPVFCRGACWTSNDVVSLVGDPERMRRTLELAAEANANMIRVGGTMVYETDAFYAECDRLGLMVWQDFMFANMDYPVDDEAFAAAIEVEAAQQLGRLARHPSVVAYCGGSEVEQQAAMFGAPKEIWSNAFFSNTLPRLVEQHDPGMPYWPSTPTGGALPFHVGEGLTHYYGVGAYKRPLEDVRLADVKFTPECLGFSNVPEPANLRKLTPSGSVAPHHPAWKAGVPRDSGAGWDFEDIRDHYLEVLYGVDAVELRSQDTTRYERLSRVVTGRVMARVFDEWRSPLSRCGGGLVWFLQDLRPGAGWGVIDSDNRPKAAYYFLKRSWAPRRLAILDRGLDGLRIELHNERAAPVEGTLEVRILGRPSNTLARAERALAAPARGAATLALEELLEHFADPTYSYRFGPLRHAAIEARFTAQDGSEPLVQLYWPSLAEPLPTVEIEGSLDGAEGVVRATGLAREVRVEVQGGVPDQNYRDLTAESALVFSTWTEDGATEGLRGFADTPDAREAIRIRAAEGGP